MKKIIAFLLIALIVSLVALFFWRKQKFSAQPSARPKIVESFACDDYCPGGLEEYTVKIYEGIQDEQECRQIGGEPYTYYGWTEHHICLAKEDFSWYYKFRAKESFQGILGILQDLIFRLK